MHEMNKYLLKKPSRWLYAVVVFLIAALIVTEGCFCLGDYDTFSLKRGIAHFSFEYPCGYKKSPIDITDGYTDIFLRGPYHKSIEDFTWFSIWVQTSDDPDFLDPEAALNRAISRIKNYLDYRLIERSVINVAGIEGQQIIYFHNAVRPALGQAGYIPGVGPAPTIERKIYFSDEGRIWNIDFNSNESTAEADMADFEHLLKTFTILE
jgi:hypothetical protein